MSDLIKRHKIFFGIITLLLLLTIPLVVLQVQTQQTLRQRAAGGVDAVFLDPSSAELTVDNNFSVAILINNPGGKDISGADITLTYPLTLLSYVNFTPTSDNNPFHFPVLAEPNINNGSFHLVVANHTVAPIDATTINVGTLTFKPIAKTTSGPAEVKFSAAQITASGFPDALIVPTLSGTYTINDAQVPTATPTPSPAPKQSPCPPYGDVDGDGMVSMNDALLIAKHVAGSTNNPPSNQLTSEQQRIGNVNDNKNPDGSDLLDIGDSLFIAQYLVGTRSTFPVCSITPTPTPTPTTWKIREQLNSCLSPIVQVIQVWVKRNDKTFGFRPIDPDWANDLKEIFPQEEVQMKLADNCTLTYNNYTYNLVKDWNTFIWEPLPTPTPTPSVTPAAGNTILQLPPGAFVTLFTNRKDDSPMTDKDQDITIYLYRSDFDPSTDPTGENAIATATIKLASSGTDITSFNLGKLAAGTYKILLKGAKYLRAQIDTRVIGPNGGIITLVLLNKNLADGAGDVNNDNILDIRDYNMIVNCFGPKQDTATCTDKNAADLNDDGVVDGIDYNIFLTSLTFTRREGD